MEGLINTPWWWNIKSNLITKTYHSNFLTELVHPSRAAGDCSHTSHWPAVLPHPPAHCSLYTYIINRILTKRWSMPDTETTPQHILYWPVPVKLCFYYCIFSFNTTLSRFFFFLQIISLFLINKILQIALTFWKQEGQWLFKGLVSVTEGYEFKLLFREKLLHDLT